MRSTHSSPFPPPRAALSPSPSHLSPPASQYVYKMSVNPCMWLQISCASFTRPQWFILTMQILHLRRPVKCVVVHRVRERQLHVWRGRSGAAGPGALARNRANHRLTALRVAAAAVMICSTEDCARCHSALLATHESQDAS
eukprot:358044-Chlamydomonas_euryale.AAC.4